MSVELHLPDLPEVRVALGAPVAAPAPTGGSSRQVVPWPVRLRDVLATYLPLLLMALLALGSWWLVKNIPLAPKAREVAPPRSEPDYTMHGFTIERFEPAGRLKLRMSGTVMRHFPDTDRIEVEQLRFEAFAPDGRVTRGHARRGLSNGDGSEIVLEGGAQISQPDHHGQPIKLSSERLRLFTVSERISTDQPVLIERTGQRARAMGMEYDHGRGLLNWHGPARSVMAPGTRREAPAP
jgi:lipopolysaccharide export system protein LptC